jgi:hypothetical protein
MGIAVTYTAYPKLCGNPNQAAYYADVVPYTAYCVNLGLVDVINAQGIGRSPNSHTAYTITLEVVHVLGLWEGAVIIFWKRSDDRMVLLVSLTLLLLGSSDNHLVDTLIHNDSAWDLPAGITGRRLLTPCTSPRASGKIRCCSSAFRFWLIWAESSDTGFLDVRRCPPW